MSGVEFLSSGLSLGRVTVEGDELVASSPTLQPVIEAYLGLGGKPRRFVDEYEGWSNGSVTTRRVD